VQCVVTGASGYIGRALVPGLRDASWAVRALGGPSAGSDGLERIDVASRRVPDWTPLLAGTEQVFHLAGVAHQYASADLYRRVNVDGTLTLARAARDAGVTRFIFFSSVKAAQAVREEGISGEPDAAVIDYARSKALAENGLRALCADGSMDLVILRPALVYGPDAPGHLAWLRRWVRARLPAPPPGGARSMIGRQDLVRLCLAITAAQSLPPNLCITVTDGEAYSTRRLHAALCHAEGRFPLLPSPGQGVWRAAASLLDRVRGQAPGSTWGRLAGSELHASEGLTALAFEPALTFETSIGVAS